jgi:hypothetical protein
LEGECLRDKELLIIAEAKKKEEKLKEIEAEGKKAKVDAMIVRLQKVYE